MSLTRKSAQPKIFTTYSKQKVWEETRSSELGEFHHRLLEKFTDKEIKIIQERVRANSSRPNWLENQFDDLDLNGESVPMQTD